jgi:RNA recognition motif-containing protein
MGSRLFVGNLPYSCTEDDLKSLFAPRYRVGEVRIVTDRETGRSRGFGFVELEDDDSVRDAIGELDGRELGGRRIAIREAHERTGGGGKPPRGRSGDRAPVSVDTMTRRSPIGVTPPPRNGARNGGRSFQAEPPPDAVSFSGGNKDRKRKRRRDEPNDW